MTRNLAIAGTVLAALAVIGVTAVAPRLSFASTAFLVGLAAALLPLLIHLINRRRAKVRRFAAMAFLLSTNKRVAQKLKLRQLLLLLVRTLLIACIPLALSKPSYQREASELSAAAGPSATAIVLDNSLSMAYRLEGQSLFDRARARALAYLSDLPREATAAAVLPASPPGEGPTSALPELTFDHAQVRERIRSARVVPRASDLEDAIRLADRLLALSPLQVKRIVVLTDLARHAWPGRRATHAPITLGPGVTLFVHDVSRGAVLPNRAVLAVSLAGDPDLGLGGYAVTARIANYAPRAAPGVAVDLRIDGRVVSRGVVDLPARGEVTKVFHHRFPLGRLVRGAVSLQADALTDDDLRRFVVDVRRPARALVLNGDPRPVPYLDELFYLERALRPTGSPVRLRIESADESSATPLAGFDLVFACNVRELSARRVDELRTFVRRGGGLFISLGDNVEPDYYNALLGPLLPRRLRAIRDVTYGGGAPVRLARPKLTHPILSVFAGDAMGGLVSAEVRRYVHVEPGDPRQVLLQYDDGAPALLQHSYGRGRVLLLTTTLDRDWTDLPIRTGFLPILQQSARFLAGRLSAPGAPDVLVGEARAIPLHDGVEEVVVAGPGGKRFRFAGEALRGKRELRFRSTGRPGIYALQLFRQGKREPGGAFAVNGPPSESNLEKLSPAQVSELAPRPPEATGPTAVAAAAVGRTALWPWVALALLVFLLVESVLVRRA